MASIPCTDVGSSGMPLGATWGSDPGGRSWGPGSSESYFRASLGRGMLEDSLRCHYFSRVNFSYIASSEFSSTRFLQFPGNVPFLVCSTVENVLSKTIWYWGETCPVLMFNTRSTDPVLNG